MMIGGGVDGGDDGKMNQINPTGTNQTKQKKR